MSANIGFIAGGASPRRIWATASEELLIELRLQPPWRRSQPPKPSPSELLIPPRRRQLYHLPEMKACRSCVHTLLVLPHSRQAHRLQLHRSRPILNRRKRQATQEKRIITYLSQIRDQIPSRWASRSSGMRIDTQHLPFRHLATEY